MAKLIFRKFIEAKEQIEASLRRKEISGEDFSLETKQLCALKQIYEYIRNDVTWAGQKRSRIKAMIFLKNHCDYEKTKEELHAKSKNSIEVSMSYLSKKLESKIGANTIYLIKEGKVDEAIIQFETGTGMLNPKDYVIEGLIDLLPAPVRSHTSLSACEKELKLLLVFTQNHLTELAAKYNQENLSYLMYVLTSTDRAVAIDRRVLYQLLKGEFSRDTGGESVELKVQIAMALEEYANR
ncbi:hypothetical protein [Lysinibacillus fusiformis]|uniref:hypothetical protein n=1 Tax=Lysinibacillus fusiformis TaxID=28031 RepID=UPI003CFBB33B